MNKGRMRIIDHSELKTEGDYYIMEYVGCSGWLWWRRKQVHLAFIECGALGANWWRCAATGLPLDKKIDKRLDVIAKRNIAAEKKETAGAQALDSFRNRHQQLNDLTVMDMTAQTQNTLEVNCPDCTCWQSILHGSKPIDYIDADCPKHGEGVA